jgi:hypothetical protein
LLLTDLMGSCWMAGACDSQESLLRGTRRGRCRREGRGGRRRIICTPVPLQEMPHRHTEEVRQDHLGHLCSRPRLAGTRWHDAVQPVLLLVRKSRNPGALQSGTRFFCQEPSWQEGFRPLAVVSLFATLHSPRVSKGAQTLHKFRSIDFRFCSRHVVVVFSHAGHKEGHAPPFLSE